jgi:hypothetical protein
MILMFGKAPSKTDQNLSITTLSLYLCFPNSGTCCTEDVHDRSPDCCHWWKI